MALAEKALLDYFYLNTGQWTLERVQAPRGQNLEQIKFDSDKIGKLIETFVFNELSAQIEANYGEYRVFHYRDREVYVNTNATFILNAIDFDNHSVRFGIKWDETYSEWDWTKLYNSGENATINHSWSHASDADGFLITFIVEDEFELRGNNVFQRTIDVYDRE